MPAPKLQLILALAIVLVSFASCSASVKRVKGRNKRSLLTIPERHGKHKAKRHLHPRKLDNSTTKLNNSVRPLNNKVKRQLKETREPIHSKGNCGEPINSKHKTSNVCIRDTPTEHEVETPDVALDVGEVMVASVSDSCNGVLLEPSIVLTSASCVYPDHKSAAHANISFAHKGTKKMVEKVFGNPRWHETGERKANFALLKLAHPVAKIEAKHLTGLTWSPYALEDIGESFLATPEPTSCQTASRNAKKTNQIRHVGEEIITVSCKERGKALPGSPFFRWVDGIPVVYGVYFGQCTSGSLDRKTTGSCGSRISKQVFQDFCSIAKKEIIDLPDCNSSILNQLNSNFPTTILTNEGYQAVSSTVHNRKGAVFLYHSSASSQHQELVDDVESIQRLKAVNDKFQFAIIDIEVLPFRLSFVPFIEYRTVSGKTYLPYVKPYDFNEFKTFMDEFSKVGAPPKESTSFIQHLVLLKRDKVPTNEGSSEVQLVHSHNIEGSAGAKFARLNCDENAYEIGDDPHKCECMPGYIGNGEAHNCQAMNTAIQENCRYDIKGEQGAITRGQTYEELAAATKNVNSWCMDKKAVFIYLSNDDETVLVKGKALTPDHCAEEVQELVRCTTAPLSMADDVSFRHSYRHGNDNSTSAPERHRRTLSTTKDMPTVHYLSSFLENIPPGPMTYHPNSHFIYNDWLDGATNQFSTLFNAKRGIPEIAGYKLTNDQMGKLNKKKRLLYNLWYFDTGLSPYPLKRQGKNLLYVGRGDKKFSEAVEEGQLNPIQINSFDEASMRLTHAHTNAFPQFSHFKEGVWRSFEHKILEYAKDRCHSKSSDSEFHLITGLSDYELKGNRYSAFLTSETYWPLAYEGGVAQPPGSSQVPPDVKSIVQPKSVWTVGCCSWKEGDALKGESVSIWANNKPRGVPKSEIQPNLASLAKGLYPGKECFQFFPANSQCTKQSNHYTLA